MPRVVIGTAGHIDHGKTSLVKALTGMDTDSLAEEKLRGLTIDLGFAYLSKDIAIIDVPGHEKFIRNMVAGASNIHIGLIVIAADDGVMPQTKEHLDILMHLGVSKGMVALTKIDKVNDKEWLALVEMDIQDLMDSVGFEFISIRKVNTLSGEGVKKVEDDILSLAKDYKFNNNSNNFRLYVDRVFSKTGFGTIVTGTVQSGEIDLGSQIEIMPSKIKTKVRGLHSHNGEVTSISIGQRAAINLSNVSKNDLKRGSVLSEVDFIKPTKKIVCYVSLIKATKWVIKTNQRLRFHIGTEEIIGRIILSKFSRLKNGMSDNAIIEFESITSVAMNDKILIRSYSPLESIAGGIVLDINPKGKRSEIKNWIKEIPLSLKNRFYYFIKFYLYEPKSIKNWALFFNIHSKVIKNWVKENNLKSTSDKLIYSNSNLDKTKKIIELFFKDQYKLNPYRLTINIDSIIFSLKITSNWLKFVLNQMINDKLIIEEKGGYRSTKYNFKPSKKDINDLNRIEKIISESGFEPLMYKEIISVLKIMPNHLSELLYVLQNKKKILYIGEDLYIAPNNFKKIIEEIKIFFLKEDKMLVSDFKKITSLSRKKVIPLLEYLDKKSYTIRLDNKRLKGESLYG